MGSAPASLKPVWYRRRWFAIVATVLGVLLLIALAAPYFLNLDRYRAAITEIVRKETGRELALESLRLHFLPLRVEVANLRLLNPGDFPAGDTFSVRRIAVGLAWRPLLRREVEIDSLTFEEVTLNLLTNDAGQTNYHLLDKLTRAQRTAKKSTDEPAPVRLTQIDEIELRGLEVSAGSFARRTKRVVPSWRLSGVSAEARGFDFTRRDWEKQMEASVPLSNVELHLAAFQRPLRLAKGQVTVKNFAAEGDCELALGSLHASGHVRIADLAKPVADFELRANEVNLAELNTLLAAQPESQPASGGRAPATAGGASPGPTELLARGTMEAKSVKLPPLAAENFRATLRLYTTRLEVEPVTLALYGGTAKAATRIDLASNAKPASVSLELAGVDIGKVTAAANPKSQSRLTGIFEGKLDLNLQLGAADPAKTLAGQGSFAVRDGTFPGLDVRSSLGKLAQFLALGVPQGETRFSAFGGDLRIADRRVHSQKLRLEAEGLEADVRGSLGFDGTLDYAGSGILEAGASAESPPADQNLRGALRELGRNLGGAVTQALGGPGKFRIPFRVGGTVEQPKFVLTGAPQRVQTEPQTEEQKKRKKLFGIF